MAWQSRSKALVGAAAQLCAEHGESGNEVLHHRDLADDAQQSVGSVLRNGGEIGDPGKLSKAAYLLVGKGAHRISLFIFRPQDAPRTIGTPPASMSALSWQDKGLTFVAVADVPEGDLEQLRLAFER